MMVRRARWALMASICMVPTLLVQASPVALAAPPHAGPPVGRNVRQSAQQPSGGRIAGIRVVGNHRIATSTVLSYILLEPGDKFSNNEINLSLKTLYATGLFSNAAITRQGDTLVVTVRENPVVNQVYFEGNKAVKSKALKKVVSLQPGAVFTTAAAASDTKAVLGAFAKHGRYDARVTPEIVRLPENRVNVVFKTVQGPETLISRINFIGNHRYDQSKLREVISSRQNAWFRFLSDSDHYDPQRIKYDEELLTRFYFHHGYADFKLDSATAQLSPNRKSFFLTFVMNEGPRFRVSSVQVVSSVPHLSGKSLRALVPIEKGNIFDGDALRTSVKRISTQVQNKGFAFAQVEPDVKENKKAHTIALTFNVINGPRVYVRNVDIVGNTRTEDGIIRRQIELAPGDAYNQTAVKRSKQNLEDLGFFSKKGLSVKPVPAGQADQVNLVANVPEKANGQFSLGGGYSSYLGALVNIGLSQNDFIGTGINASISALLAQRGSQFNLGVTNPYFLGRNLVAGFDLFRTDTANTTSYVFSERSIGGDVRLGFRYNQHVSQAFSYTLSTRNIFNVSPGASIYILSEQGATTLSQVTQSLTFNYTNNEIDPTRGGEISFTTSFAGLGGTAKYLRLETRAAYYVPLRRYLGNKGYVLEFKAHVGYLYDLFGYHSTLSDRFFLGGDSLLGFQTGGAGPHDTVYGNSLGGRFIYTEDNILNFPLPVSPDLGVSGFAFADVGSLSGISQLRVGGVVLPVYDNPAPRVSVGLGVAWNTPFGLIDLSFAQPIKKYKYDQIEQFRVSFGTHF